MRVIIFALVYTLFYALLIQVGYVPGRMEVEVSGLGNIVAGAVHGFICPWTWAALTWELPSLLDFSGVGIAEESLKGDANYVISWVLGLIGFIIALRNRVK